MNTRALFLSFLLWAPILYGASAKIASFTGTVQVSRGDDDQKRPVRVGESLNVGDRIRTLAGASAVIQFQNGSTTAVGEATLFTVRSLGEGSSTKVSLGLLTGGLRNSIRKLSANEEFSISTPAAIAGVRGTEIDVYHQGRKSRIELHSGKAVVKTAQGEENLDPGEAADIEEGSAAVKRKLSSDELRRGGDSNRGPEPSGTNSGLPPKDPNGTNLGPRPGTNAQGNMPPRPAGNAQLQILQPIVPPFLVGMAQKGSHIVVKVNDRVVVDEPSLGSGSFRFNIESALVEDPTGERENKIVVRAETPGGGVAMVPLTFRYDRTPPSLTTLMFRVDQSRLMVEGGIGEAGFLTVAGNPVPLDPRGRVLPGFAIPLDRLNEGPNSIIAVDRAGNRQAQVWQVRKPRLPPLPPQR